NRWPSQKACVEVSSVMVSSLDSDDTSLTGVIHLQKMWFMDRLHKSMVQQDRRCGDQQRASLHPLDR
ncbi:hypothetical protein, partial [Halomonas tibetensis]